MKVVKMQLLKDAKVMTFPDLGEKETHAEMDAEGNLDSIFTAFALKTHPCASALLKKQNAVIMMKNHIRARCNCRRDVQFSLFTKVKIVEYNDHIWNKNETCTRTGTNKPYFGPVALEITC